MAPQEGVAHEATPEVLEGEVPIEGALEEEMPADEATAQEQGEFVNSMTSAPYEDVAMMRDGSTMPGDVMAEAPVGEVPLGSSPAFPESGLANPSLPLVAPQPLSSPRIQPEDDPTTYDQPRVSTGVTLDGQGALSQVPERMWTPDQFGNILADQVQPGVLGVGTEMPEKMAGVLTWGGRAHPIVSDEKGNQLEAGYTNIFGVMPFPYLSARFGPKEGHGVSLGTDLVSIRGRARDSFKDHPTTRGLIDFPIGWAQELAGGESRAEFLARINKEKQLAKIEDAQSKLKDLSNATVKEASFEMPAPDDDDWFERAVMDQLRRDRANAREASSYTNQTTNSDGSSSSQVRYNPGARQRTMQAQAEAEDRSRSRLASLYGEPLDSAILRRQMALDHAESERGRAITNRILLGMLGGSVVGGGAAALSKNPDLAPLLIGGGVGLGALAGGLRGGHVSKDWVPDTESAYGDLVRRAREHEKTASILDKVKALKRARAKNAVPAKEVPATLNDQYAASGPTLNDRFAPGTTGGEDVARQRMLRQIEESMPKWEGSLDDAGNEKIREQFVDTFWR